MYLLLPISFYINGKKYIKKSVLDLGNEGEGFHWSRGSVKKIIDMKIDSNKIKTGTITTVTREISTSMPLKFDSVSLSDNLIIKNINSRISFSSNGISGSDIVLFGNSLLSRFGEVVIDFRKNKLYTQRVK